MSKLCGCCACEQAMSGGVVRAWLSTFIEEDLVPSKRAEAAKLLASRLLTVADRSDRQEQILSHFNSAFMKKLNTIVNQAQSVKKFSEQKEMMWRELHSQRSTVLKGMWLGLLEDFRLHDHEGVLLLQYLVEKIFEEVVKAHFVSIENRRALNELSCDEHNALRYVAGYVPFAILKDLKRTGTAHPFKDAFVECLKSLAHLESENTEEETIQSYTKRWVNAVDRGGLFRVKDEVYSLFVELEKKLRVYMSDVIRKRKIDRAFIEDALTSDEDVLFHWCIVSTTLDDQQASRELLRKIVHLYVTIRGFSSAGAFVEYYKQCTKKTSNSNSLRTTLKKKHIGKEQQ